MKRINLIKKTAKAYLNRKGLSETVICGKTSNGRNVSQLERIELELGTLTNFGLKKLYTEYTT